MNKKELSLKKKECKSLSTKVDLNLNTVDSLRRLSKALSELDNDSKVSTDNVGLPMGSWRDLSDSLQSAYTMMSSGAELVKATSTKYTLLGKINVADGSKLAVSFVTRLCLSISFSSIRANMVDSFIVS